MKNPIICFTIGLITAVLTTAAWGFDIGRTITEAEIVPPGPITPAIQLNFRAKLFNGDFGGLSSKFVVVTWVPPEPFSRPPAPLEVLNPPGCFDPNDFHVRDFRACGVRMTVVDDEKDSTLSIMDFEARLKPRRDGSASFAIEARFTARDQEEHATLAILSGAVVEIAIGTERGTSLPTAVKTVSVPPSPI